VHLGALNSNDESEEGRVIVTSNQATLHKNYNGIVINNDITIIRLPDSVSGPCIHQVQIYIGFLISCRHCTYSAALVVWRRSPTKRGWGEFSDSEFPMQ